MTNDNKINAMEKMLAKVNHPDPAIAEMTANFIFENLVRYSKEGLGLTHEAYELLDNSFQDLVQRSTLPTDQIITARRYINRRYYKK